MPYNNDAPSSSFSSQATPASLSPKSSAADRAPSSPTFSASYRPTATLQRADAYIYEEPPSPTSKARQLDPPESDSCPPLSMVVSATDTLAVDVDSDKEDGQTTAQQSPQISSTPSRPSSPTPQLPKPAHETSEDRRDPDSSSQHSQSSEQPPDRIRSVRDVVDAFKLTWQNQKWALFTSWVHVPIGIVFLLFICWAFKLAIDQAPFRFPAPVLAMAAFFFSLLALDWLSIKFPGKDQASEDPEKNCESRDGSERRRFVEPVMKLLAPPCEFCLRNMSVMFTPSFILIPAREVIPGKEIGLLTAWFAISQVAAFVFPVLLHRALTWMRSQPKKIQDRYRKKQQRKEELRRIQSRRSSNATLAGGELAKQMSQSGGRRLSTLATGLNDLTAIITAPVSHLTMGKSKSRYEDERLHITHVQIETARQQGDPAVSTPADIANMTGSPLAQYDGFQQHRNMLHHHHHHHHPGMQRGRSMTKRPTSSRSNSNAPARSSSRGAGPRSRSVPAPMPQFGMDHVTPPLAQRTWDTPTSRRTFNGDERTAVDNTPTSTSRAPSDEIRVDLDSYRFDEPRMKPKKLSIVFDEDSIRPDDLRRPSRADSQMTVHNPRLAELDEDGVDMIHAEKKGLEAAAVVDETVGRDPVSVRNAASAADDDNDAYERGSTTGSVESECEHNAVERLSEWIADLITPLVYFTMFIVGIPLFFALDFALPLFLGINLLTFLAAISIVPPAWRRYLHPILTTSVATVLIIWAFGEMKGLSLSGALSYYSYDAKYLVLWDLDGYSGPVPGAGDFLFSTLDAGIVALAVPMYRYRRDLAENFTRMMAILTPCAALSLFFWPYIGRLFGLDPTRSLAFSARFMSTPLAIELANTIGADESITVIMVVITGILAAILKEPFFKLMRISMDDHICVGVTMGSTAGAIGASSLISRPRVMAVASLAFVLFGTLLLICAAIPNIVDVVRQLCNAPVDFVPVE